MSHLSLGGGRVGTSVGADASIFAGTGASDCGGPRAGACAGVIAGTAACACDGAHV